MPKSKKKKKADFQKVKLKVGKKLPKGDNVMNLSFKTRQIQLTQKIRDTESNQSSSGTTKQKYTVMELLRQCDHHSTNSRLNAVSGLKETWLGSYSDLVVTSNEHGCAEILKKLSSMLIDNEGVVRHSVINLFKVILNKMQGLGENKNGVLVGGGLFKHIHAYLCCAMNHVHEDIRLDALILFDALLDTFPKFIVQQTGDLLNNLLGLISAPLTFGGSMKGNSTTQRLSMNPESKLPALTFCTRVLSRIKRTFQEAFSEEHLSEKTTSGNIHGHRVKTWKLGVDPANTSTQDTLLVPVNIAHRFHSISSIASAEMGNYITKPESLEEFCRLALPVLIQCWKEAKAELSDQNASETSGSADCYEVMSLVVSITELVFSLYLKLRSSTREPLQFAPMFAAFVSVEACQKDFAQVFMEDFPHCGHVEIQSHKKKKQKTSILSDSRAMQNSLISLNLGICHIFSCFYLDRTLTQKCLWLPNILDYITSTLRKSPKPEQTNLITKILRNVFVNPRALESSSEAFKVLWTLYSSGHVKNVQKKSLYNLFSMMVKEWDGWTRQTQGPQPVYRYPNCEELQEILEQFSQNLPSLLLDVIKIGGQQKWVLDILATMCCGHVQNCSSSFHGSFQDKLVELLDPNSGILVYGNEAIQRKFIFLLSLGQSLHKDHLKGILYAVRRPVDKPVLPHVQSCSLACQMITNVFLNMRKNFKLQSQKEFLKMDDAEHSAMADYMAFLFSLQMGMTGEELEAMDPSVKKQNVKGKWTVINYEIGEEQWSRHVDVSKYVISELMNLWIAASPAKGSPQPLTFVSDFQQRWKNILSHHCRIHIMSVYSLVQFLHQASMRDHPLQESNKLLPVAAHVIAGAITSLFGGQGDTEMIAVGIIERLKSDVVQCLSENIALVPEIWKCLILRSQGAFDASESGKHSASLAMEFLMFDECLRDKIPDV